MKVDLLGGVANQGEVEARTAAVLLGLSPAAAAMALLRAYRAGLLTRAGAIGGVGFTYTLTDKGWLRFRYLAGESEPTSQTRSRHTVNHTVGGHDVRTRKLYSATYHCPQCPYEITLRDEGSLRCEDCGGRLDDGALPEEEGWNGDDDDEED
jgi:hypothetical protein